MNKQKLLANIKKHQKAKHQITTNNRNKWVITFEAMVIDEKNVPPPTVEEVVAKSMGT